MTIHVIDASRPLPPVYGQYQSALNLEVGDTVLLAAGAGAEIAAYGDGGDAIAGNYDTTLVIYGRVHSEYASALGANGIVTLGTAEGASYGVYLFDDYATHLPNTLINAGTISGGEAGVRLDGMRNTITNTGMIVGYVGISDWSGYDPDKFLTVPSPTTAPMATASIRLPASSSRCSTTGSSRSRRRPSSKRPIMAASCRPCPSTPHRP